MQSILDDDIMRVMQIVFRLYYTDLEERIEEGPPEEINGSLTLESFVDIYDDTFWDTDVYLRCFQQLGRDGDDADYLWDYFNKYYTIGSSREYLLSLEDPSSHIYAMFEYISAESLIMININVYYHSKYKEMLKTWAHEEFSIIPK